MRHIWRGAIPMLLDCKFWWLSIKVIWKPFLYVLAKFDWYYCLVIWRVRGTCVCSSSHHNIRTCLSVDLFKFSHFPLLVSYDGIKLGLAACHYPWPILVWVQLFPVLQCINVQDKCSIVLISYGNRFAYKIRIFILAIHHKWNDIGIIQVLNRYNLSLRITIIEFVVLSIQFLGWFRPIKTLFPSKMLKCYYDNICICLTSCIL